MWSFFFFKKNPWSESRNMAKKVLCFPRKVPFIINRSEIILNNSRACAKEYQLCSFREIPRTEAAKLHCSPDKGPFITDIGIKLMSVQHAWGVPGEK